MTLTASLMLHIALCAAPQLAWHSYANFNDINQLSLDSAGLTLRGATTGGTFRFSITDTVLLGHATNVDGLPCIEANCVAAAPDGRTWIGTNGGGIGWFASNGGVAGAPIDGDAGLRSDTILALLYYRSGPAERLVAGMPGGLALIDASDGSVLRNFYQSQGYPVHRAVRALTLRHDSLWVGSDSGVSVVPIAGIYATASWASHTAIAGLSPDVRALFANDTMIVAGTVNGAARWLSGPSWQRYTGIGGPVRAVAQVGDSIFFATGGGVLRYCRGLIDSVASRNSGLPGTRVRSLTTGAASQLWAGTDAGLAKFSGVTWQTYPFNCISNNDIGKITLSPDGTVWASPNGYVDSLTHGLLVNVLRAGTWRSYPNPIPGNPVTSILIDADGKAWCGLGWWNSATLRMFIVRIDVNGADTIITTPPLPPQCGVGASYLDPAGPKYFSAYSNEATNHIVRFSPDGAVTFLRDPSPVGSYSQYMWIISIAKDHDGALWLGSFYNYFTRFDEATGIWSHFGPESGLPDINIRSIAVGDDNALWLATGQGLARGRYDAASGRLAVTTWNTANSRLLSNVVRAVRLDSRGNAWIATDQGLSVRTWDGQWINYTAGDIDRNGSKLLSDNVNDIAIGPRDAEGDDIWVTTNKGLNLLRCSIGQTAPAATSSVAPNPFDPNQDHSLVFSQLPSQSTVRMYTIDGRLVGSYRGPTAPAHQLVLRAGRDLNAAALPSGLYLCHISAPDAPVTVLKLVIVR